MVDFWVGGSLAPRSCGNRVELEGGGWGQQQDEQVIEPPPSPAHLGSWAALSLGPGQVWGWAGPRGAQEECEAQAVPVQTGRAWASSGKMGANCHCRTGCLAREGAPLFLWGGRGGRAGWAAGLPWPAGDEGEGPVQQRRLSKQPVVLWAPLSFRP